MKFEIRVVIEEDADRFHGYCPDLRGVHVDGDTVEEARENIREAATQHLEYIAKSG